MVNSSRRGFLRGRPRAEGEIRPPWAIAEAEFLSACTRCSDCIVACPQGILAAGGGNYPRVDFGRGECTFCSDCVTACRPHALLRVGDDAPWTLRARIGDTCLPRRNVECRVCGDWCGAGAIRFAPRLGGSPLPAVDDERCTGCGACVAPCPVAAIAIGPAATA
ncbi:MAG: ferredoxin-type protein NapF [Betaproteobacteria bacterium]|nr:ferredoxin-type protein NapF [Betaproteobacteria bacterium]